jgi:lambda repressor-like predicted transcriptional regulator
MADDRSKPITNREFLAERDMRIFKMRQAGTSVAEIARRFGISSGTVSRAIQRQLEKMNREAILAYPEMLRLELERLDSLQQAIWPMTQHRKSVMDDGTEVQLEPDIKAIQQVLSIMDRRTKLLGVDQTNVNVQMDVTSGGQAIRATIAGQPGMEKPAIGFDAESEAKKMLELMAIAGVLPQHTVDSILRQQGEIIDAEIVDDEDEEKEHAEEESDQ